MKDLPYILGNFVIFVKMEGYIWQLQFLPTLALDRECWFPPKGAGMDFRQIG